jgi:hypothetical protein
MVLAVDIRRDGPAYGDLPGAWTDGHKPPHWDHDPNARVEAGACFNGDSAVLGVKVDYRVQAFAKEDVSTSVLRGVAVAAAESSGDGAARRCVPEHRRNFSGLGRLDHNCPSGRGAAPAGQHLDLAWLSACGTPRRPRL